MELTNWIMLSLPALMPRCTIIMCQTNVQESDKKACISSFFAEHKYIYVFLESYTERLDVIKSNSIYKNTFIRIVHDPKDI